MKKIMSVTIFGSENSGKTLFLEHLSEKYPSGHKQTRHNIFLSVSVPSKNDLGVTSVQKETKSSLLSSSSLSSSLSSSSFSSLSSSLTSSSSSSSSSSSLSSSSDTVLLKLNEELTCENIYYTTIDAAIILYKRDCPDSKIYANELQTKLTSRYSDKIPIQIIDFDANSNTSPDEDMMSGIISKIINSIKF